MISCIENSLFLYRKLPQSRGWALGRAEASLKFVKVQGDGACVYWAVLLTVGRIPRRLPQSNGLNIRVLAISAPLPARMWSTQLSEEVRVDPHNVGLCGSTVRQGGEELDVLARVRLHRPPRHAARVGVDALSRAMWLDAVW